MGGKVLISFIFPEDITLTGKKLCIFFNEVEIPPTFIPNKSTPGTTVGVMFAFLKWLTLAKVTAGK